MGAMMEGINIIGLAGPARSGKNTVAEIICGQMDFVIFSFASPLHQLAMSAFDFDNPEELDELKDSDILCRDITPRRLMQVVGTEIARQLDPDVWVNAMHRRLLNHTWCLSAENVVISDVRFENEADYVRNIGRLWHVQRARRDSIGDASRHASEQGVSICPDDIVISNNGSLDDLQAAVIAALGEKNEGR